MVVVSEGPRNFSVALRAGRLSRCPLDEALSGSETLVHRSLWPAFLAVAVAGEPRQHRGLSGAALAAFSLCVNHSTVPVRAAGSAVKELVSRLLCARDRGAHGIRTPRNGGRAVVLMGRTSRRRTGAGNRASPRHSREGLPGDGAFPRRSRGLRRRSRDRAADRSIERLTPPVGDSDLRALARLLVDAVESGAAVGLLGAADARACARRVAQDDRALPTRARSSSWRGTLKESSARFSCTRPGAEPAASRGDRQARWCIAANGVRAGRTADAVDRGGGAGGRVWPPDARRQARRGGRGAVPMPGMDCRGHDRVRLRLGRNASLRGHLL